MRNYKAIGIIIKRRNIGEADRYLTILTKNGEKMYVKAVGVRRITSRRSAHIEPLNLGRLTFYKGKGMPILTEAETISDFLAIKEDLTKVGFAYHICELIDGLCPDNQENHYVFALLKDTLEQLAKSDDIASIIHDFEIELLTLLGFWPRGRQAHDLNTSFFIENILERKLKSKRIFAKL